MATKFRDYLKSRNLNINSYAPLVGSSASHLYGIDSGDKVPSFELAYRIDVETEGKIPMRYWGDYFGWEEKTKEELKERANG